MPQKTTLLRLAPQDAQQLCEAAVFLFLQLHTPAIKEKEKKSGLNSGVKQKLTITSITGTISFSKPSRSYKFCSENEMAVLLALNTCNSSFRLALLAQNSSLRRRSFPDCVIEQP